MRVAPLLILIFSFPLGKLHAQSVNPYEGDASALRLGATLFGPRCSACHGADAKGIVAPDLTALWVNGTDDQRVFQVIRQGIPGSVMPPSTAPDHDIWALVAWLKSINLVPPADYSNGNAQRGEALYGEHCGACHRRQGDGGSLGPDLSTILRRRTRADLVSAIREPDLAIDRAYRTISVILADGSPLQGALKNEDSFTLQMMTTEQQLRGLLKQDLRAISYPDASLMPAYSAQLLPDQALEDIFAYLATSGGVP